MCYHSDMKITAIGFDYGGVIAGILGSEFNRQVTDLLGIPLQTYHGVYYRFNRLRNENILSREDFWRKITKELGVSEKYHDLMNLMDTLRSDKVHQNILDLIDRLRANGYKTGLLSNNSVEMAQRIRANGLVDHFDATIVSAEVGCSKPSPEIFQMFLDHLGIPAKELVYIDDAPKSLSTAGEIGYHPILFTNYESLLISLRSVNVNI